MTIKFGLLFITFIASRVVNINKKCSCDQLKILADCEQATGCSWHYDYTDILNGKCKVASTTQSQKNYCNSLRNQSECAETKGCAYINKECQPFAGCTAYTKTTLEECREISGTCLGGERHCTSILDCEDHMLQASCIEAQSSTGNKCFWDATANNCRQTNCTDASTALTTNVQCDQFLKGCVAVIGGGGCKVKDALACIEYSGTESECLTKVGSDGPCVGTPDANFCQVRKCTLAPINYKTNSQCSDFKKDCVTTGKGCQDPPQKSCGQYEGNNQSCKGYIGMDGPCAGDLDGKNCRLQQCSDAPMTHNTHQLCNEFMAGCKSTGSGCTNQLKRCNTYKETPGSPCLGLIGSDGKCQIAKSDSGTPSDSCVAISCEEAPPQTNNDAACEAYQFGCKTTGKGCVAQEKLGPCSSYSGNKVSCDIYIGSDGKCTGEGEDDQEKPCARRECKDAPKTFSSHIDCKNFQDGCVTNGEGCIAMETCQQSVSKLTCDGNPACSWSFSCVSGAKCSDFSRNTCNIANDGIKQTKCIWHNWLCRDIACSDAPATMISDDDCNNFLEGCVTNGKGCVTKDDPCSIYVGSRDTCRKYTRECSNVASATETSQCRERTCSEDTESITDLDCSLYKRGCKTKGKGCIEDTAPCSSYFGNMDTCAKFSGSKGTVPCWNFAFSTATSLCRAKECGDDETSTQDDECNQFMNKCVTRGKGCIAKAAPCSNYVGTQQQCNKFKGEDGKKVCWYQNAVGTGPCVDKLCGYAGVVSNQNECAQFMAGCVMDGSDNCVPETNICQQFIASPNKCTELVGNKKKCYYFGKCVDRECSDDQNKTRDQCLNYMPKCRFINNQCKEVMSCQEFVGSTVEQCKDQKTSQNESCWWESGANCTFRKCAQITSIDATSCTKHLSTCKFTSNNTCIDAQSDCTQYRAEGNDIPARNSYCLALTDSQQNACAYDGQTSHCQKKSCDNASNPTRAEDCTNHLKDCQWTGQKCTSTKNCGEYQPGGGTDTKRLEFCKKLKDTKSNFCTYQSGNSCLTRFCSNAPEPKSIADCTNWLPTCRYDGAKCVDANPTCNYAFVGAISTLSEENKRTLCEQLKNNSIVPLGCTLNENGTGCRLRICKDAPNKSSQSECEKWLPTCRFTSKGCIDSLTCANYQLEGQDLAAWNNFCETITDNSTPPQRCAFSSGKCAARTCQNARVQAPDHKSCSEWLQGCTVTYQTALGSCIESSKPCVQFQGLPWQCQKMIGDSGKQPCWSFSSSEIVYSFCKMRECTDNKSAYTNEQCEEFLKGCKTTGRGCILATTPCYQMVGTIESCSLFKNPDNTKFCRFESISKLVCTDRTCYDDVVSTTDQDCNNFLFGCVTRGKGCIHPSEPCDKYVGTQVDCSKFSQKEPSGNIIQCWNRKDATSSSPCMNKTCYEDVLATTDEQCRQILPSCVTNGTSCLPKSSPCGSYRGTQLECQKFIGLDGTQPCWNNSNAIGSTPCLERKCESNTTAKADGDCQKFLSTEKIKCVTNGKGCVSADTPCSQFFGSDIMCNTFTAKDGPCKGPSSAQQGPCLPRLCSEAPNDKQTDDDCKKWHPTCVTNGYGCVVSVTCSEIIQKTACSNKTGCVPVSQCLTLVDNCHQLQPFGPSVCNNTTVGTGINKRRCAWMNDACQVYTCENFPATLKSHEACNSESNICTTTGHGCLQMGPCSSYKTYSICKVAKPEPPEISCTWGENICRPVKCSDARSEMVTDELCNKFLAGCKTNGRNCIDPGSKCADYVTLARCTRDENGKTCLWVEGKCYTFGQCTDIKAQTHSDCQKFSEYCTSNGNSCIAITSCAETTSQIACKIGVDGICAWKPAQGAESAKCQLFQKCQDFSSSSTDVCQEYHKSCISDGLNCIKKTNCISYKTKLACDQGGVDGICIYEKDKCRLRECSDATGENHLEGITTHSSCSKFKTYTQCTSDQKQCISISLCGSYDIDSCVEGTDGPCIWENSRIQGIRCRAKVCDDYSYTNQELCQEIGSDCITDGTRCYRKQHCYLYKTKANCNAGGLSGVCAFTPSAEGSSIGTCKRMTKCSDANKDKKACQENHKHCNWIENGSESRCEDLQCRDIKNSFDCNPILSLDQNFRKLCRYIDNSCRELDGKDYGEDECYKDTFGTFTWDRDTKCTICNENQSSDEDSDTGSPTEPNSTKEDPPSPGKENKVATIWQLTLLLLVQFQFV